jgi:general secretion pathway protein I
LKATLPARFVTWGAPMRTRASKSAGFTLVEVMIALMVLGIAMGAIIQAVGRSAENVGYLRDRTLAHWVAMNKMAELQSLKKPVRNDNGREKMVDQDWYYTTKVAKMPVKLPNEGLPPLEMQRVEIQVKRDRRDEQVLATLVSFFRVSGDE